MTPFAELAVTTNFSFLRGASAAEELVEQAKALGLSAIGVADHCTLAGVVRAYVKAKAENIRLLVGARLSFADETPDILAYPKDRAAYAQLTRLLTKGNMRAEKGACHLTFEDFAEHAAGLQPIIVPPLDPGALTDAFESTIKRIIASAGQAWIAAPFLFDGLDRRRLRLLAALSKRTGAPLIATTMPLMHHPDRRALLDVITCIREKTSLDEAGLLLSTNAERHLKPPEEIFRLFAAYPEALAETQRFIAAISFHLDDLRYQYPDELLSGYATPQEALTALAWKGAERRYPDGIPDKIRHGLERELGIVERKGYAPYFLTVHDIVRFARSGEDKDGNPKEPILCQGRGSAANSMICYCLEITEVDPNKNELLFDRFVSEEREEPPDIDVDFEHERREEVIQYVYKKYGRARAGLTAVVISYRARSSIRDVGKAFGLSEDRIAALSKTQQWWTKGVTKEDARSLGLDPDDPRLTECLRAAIEISEFPRHLSQHVGGFVITRDDLHDIVPIQNAAMKDRTVVEWNKDDLEALGILKVDLLGLGMLTCIRKAFDLISAHYPNEKQVLTLRAIQEHEPAIYAMLQRSDAIGVFQVESRAQMSMLPRLKPEEFYDLVVEVAIVRPGPIQGGMVHPYLKRRQNPKSVTYPSEELKPVLVRTLGVPLFQEQAMQIAITAAGFTPPEADKLRRAMATFKRVGTIKDLRNKFIDGMLRKNYKREFAEAMFSQIEGFGEYGFPESHAASFAILVYASAWLKCHYPDVFAAALLNAQPMGFYAPAQIVRDAEEHGVEIREIDVNHSDWDSTLEPSRPAVDHLHRRHISMRNDIRSTHALRIGFRQAKGLNDDDLKRLVANRGRGYDSVRDVWLCGGITPATLEKLADADAFRSLGLNRRDALWAVRGLNRVGGQEDLPLFAYAPSASNEPDFALPPMPIGEHIVEDYRMLGLSLKGHPAGILRSELAARRAIKAEDLADTPNGAARRVAGLVLIRQRPETASGVIFMTLEDETGIANIVVWPKVYERFRQQVLGARLCAVDGVVQSESGVIHVIAERLHDFNPLLGRLSEQDDLQPPLAHADEVRRPGSDSRTQASRHPRNIRHDLRPDPATAVMPKGRNFH